MKTQLLLCAVLASGFALGQQSDADDPKSQAAFTLAELLERGAEQGSAWVQFLERPSMMCGVYHLKAGAEDGQRPHALDEVYYVVEGKATLRAGDEEFACQAGSILFVARDVEHRFVDIEADLTLVVFFAKPHEKKEAHEQEKD